MPPLVRAPIPPQRVLLVLGAGAVVLGGLVAAVTGPLAWEHGSWAAAFLVLVTGVAQHVMGWMRTPAPHDRAGWAQAGAWNLGSVLVITGTLVTSPGLVDLGSLLLVAALAEALRADLRSPAPRPRPVGIGYRLLLLVLLVSIPVGIVLAHLRA